MNILRRAALMFSAAMIISASAATDDFHKLSGNLMAYPFTDVNPPAQTPAPEGYVPFHMEHYGRHGSRWLIGENDYKTPVARLKAAESHGYLTPLGKEVLAELERIDSASYKRWGELSDKGALQHVAIGRRMAETYPQIFAPGANVDAKSTVVIRCILSMLNGVKGIQEIQPEVVSKTDASEADMYFMNFNDSKAWKWKDEADKTVLADFKKKHDPGTGYLDRLVSDHQFAVDSVAPGLLPYLYWVLANTQGHSGQKWLLDKVFSLEEAQEIWRQGNAGWALHAINSDLTRRRLPYTQRNLMRNMIESADTAVLSPRPSANLRYGHDGILVNMVTLMEIDDYGTLINDLEQLEKMGWNDYDIIPKAGNLQIVFYRPEGSTNPDGSVNSPNPDDVLVKVLLNETERRLPIDPVTGPYYSWPALRAYYLSKIDSFREIQ